MEAENRGVRNDLKSSTTLVLMEMILDQVIRSGADGVEARCAIKAALAILPDLNLPTRRFPA